MRFYIEQSGLLEEEDDEIAAKDWYIEHINSFTEFQGKAKEWITQAKQNIEDQLEKKSHSSASSESSRRSKTSSSSSILSA